MTGTVHVATDHPFVGRREELRVLEENLDAAAAGRPHVVLVEGPPGIGKTALLRRFLDGTSATVLAAGGDEAETALPYGVVEQLLRGVDVAFPAWPRGVGTRTAA
ncbi:MAG: ATP-binding protein, partial [Euzebyales bacterium]|nr:ATP-binding protein [Euzebyales bacterium]